MPSRGLHGPSKKKQTKPRPSEAAMAATMTEGERMINLLAAISSSLRRIEEIMTRPTNPAGVAGVNPLIGPSQLPGGDQEFISGQWHRRAGDVYARVAEPGSPNAGTVGETFGRKHDDDPSGTI